MLRAILFDLDDTLHDDCNAYQKAATVVSEQVARERNGIEPSALASAFVHELEGFWSAFDASTLRAGLNVRQEMWRRALVRFDVESPALALRCAESFEAARSDMYKMFPGAYEALDALRGRGLRLGLLTNGLVATHREKILRLNLEPHLDAVFLSDEIGFSKPDKRAFLHACEALDALPTETVMVGDRYDKDICGATNAGLKTVWINARNEQIPDGAAAPTSTVRAISQVPSALNVIEAMLKEPPSQP